MVQFSEEHIWYMARKELNSWPKFMVTVPAMSPWMSEKANRAAMIKFNQLLLRRKKFIHASNSTAKRTMISWWAGLMSAVAVYHERSQG